MKKTIVWHQHAVNKTLRSDMKKQQPSDDDEIDFDAEFGSGEDYCN